MNQNEREALTQQATARILSGLHQPTNAQEMIGSTLIGYGVAMFAAGRRDTEEQKWEIGEPMARCRVEGMEQHAVSGATLHQQA